MFSAWHGNFYQRSIIAGNLAFLEQHLDYYRTVFRLTISLMRLFATSPNAASARHWLKHTGVKFSAACLSTAVPLRPFLQPAWAQLYHFGPSCSLSEHSPTIAALPAACLSTALPFRPFLQPAWAQPYHCGPSCSLPEHSCTISALPAACLSTAVPLWPFLQLAWAQPYHFGPSCRPSEHCSITAAQHTCAELWNKCLTNLARPHRELHWSSLWEGCGGCVHNNASVQ